jgi:hypothetical protein
LGNGETADKAKAFLQKAGYGLPIAFATEKSPEDFGGDGLPFLVIMDKSGHIRLVHSGYDRSEPLQPELAKEIEALLNEGYVEAGPPALHRSEWKMIRASLWAAEVIALGVPIFARMRR